MNLAQAQERFEELDVARALGDLSLSEQKEYQELIKQYNFEQDSEWDNLVASVENVYTSETEGFDESFSSNIINSVCSITNSNGSQDTTRATEQSSTSHSPPSVPNKTNIISFITHPALGWIAAAIVITLFLANSPKTINKFPDVTTTVKTTIEQRDELIALEKTLKLEFAKAGSPEIQLGDVIWNVTQQKGYMKLNNIPVNDPSVAQYQLWIVDPNRDTKPVDGGVFNITDANSGIVPINAALRIDAPAAFVITMEKPGGVVVSEQKDVIAIASIAKS